MFNGVEKDFPSPTEKLARKESLKVHIISLLEATLRNVEHFYASWSMYYLALKYLCQPRISGSNCFGII